MHVKGSIKLKLLDTGKANTKIKKTELHSSVKEAVRIASLSLMPDDILCPWSIAAGCNELCLQSSGRGRFDNVAQGRQRKTDFWHNDAHAFLAQLVRELENFEKLCIKTNVKPIVRLNVISDIQWERHGIPQLFPNITFYDYTKQAHRIGKTPSNYNLMFSYSGAPKYQTQVKRALKTDAPISVVFTRIPTDPNYRFLGRPVIDGDQSDLVNLDAGKVIIGLKYKRTKADKSTVEQSDFVINPDIIATA
tara:strand:- start:6666 stop:7412 length:747 start_codon:yes stop_codon:yes gene_type:complete